MGIVEQAHLVEKVGKGEEVGGGFRRGGGSGGEGGGSGGVRGQPEGQGGVLYTNTNEHFALQHSGYFVHVSMVS